MSRSLLLLACRAVLFRRNPVKAKAQRTKAGRALLALLLPVAAFASDSPSAVVVPPASTAPALAPFTLDEAVTRALAKNFDLEIQRLANTSARDSVIIADAVFDPAVSLSTSTSNARSAKNGAVVPGSASSAENTRAGATQKIASGATLGVSTALARSENSGLSPAYNGDLSLTVRQPLLQGVGPDITHAAQERARLGVKRANTDLKGSVLTVVRNVESAYYNLVFAREQLGVRQFALDVAQKLLDENRARLVNGVAISLNVVQAEVGVANARLAVVTAGQAVRDREDALLALIGRFEFDAPLGPVRLDDDPVPAISLATSYARARASQPDLLSAQLALDQLRIDTRTAKDALQPSLDLGAALGLSSREASYGSATGQVFSGRGYDWQLDLTLSFPWGLRSENARYRQSRASLDSQQARLAQLDQILLANVRAAVRAVETGQESVALSTRARELSEQQYEQEKARLDAGLSTVRLVRDAQAELNNAQISELQARVNLRQSLSDLSRLETTTLDRYKIKLEE